MRWTRNFKAASAVAVVATAGLLTHMSPASAEPSAGVSTGVSNVSVSEEPGVPLCLNVSAATITLTNTGTFLAAGGLPFVGETRATITTTDDYWFNPLGTFSDSSCTLPYLVPVEIQVRDTATNGSAVTCSGRGSYTRQALNAYVITTALPVAVPPLTGAFPGSNTCTVNGVTALSSILTFAGNQNPCFPDGPFPVDPCGLAPEFIGVYAQV